MSVHHRALRSSIFLASLGALLGAACASAPLAPVVAPTTPKPTAPPDLWPAPFRLSSATVPESYRLHLRIDPTQQESSGTAEIDVRLAAPEATLRLHADGLVISAASATPKGLTAPETPLVAALDGKGNLALSAAAPLAGELTLHLAWRAPLTETPDSLYRAKEGEDWYAFTQFEAISARRAFPCFDEPRFKTPFLLSLEVPSGVVAVANTPEVGRDASGAGWTTFRFAETLPLPTYLLAFAVGPFDFAEGPALSGGKVPFRLVTTRGKAALAAYAVKRVPAILDWLEGWFGIAYPFPKLDLMAVPSFAAGAMENPGLVTFRDTFLLIDGEPTRPELRRRFDAITAHELGHMWFGDLVTLAWWDDTWLNEAFASWIAGHALRTLRPDDQIDLRALVDTTEVMGEDVGRDARAVRQPIREEGDIENAFDGITYEKGQAVLAMLEDWIGPEKFQAGVRSYLAEHARGSATRDDLVEHLTKASGGLDVGAVLASFVDQPGVPVVDVGWSCAPPSARGGPVDVTLVVRQAPFRVLGDARPKSERWAIPVCVAAGAAKDAREEAALAKAKRPTLVTECKVLRAAEETRVVAMPFCPRWIRANAAGQGYYRVGVAKGLPPVAVKEALPALGWLAALRARVQADDVTAAEAKAVIEAYLGQAATMLARPLGEVELEEAASALGFARWLVNDDERALSALIAKTKKIVGVQTKSRKDPWQSTVLAKMALRAHDARAEAEALRVTERWLLPFEPGDHAEPPPLPAESLGQAVLWMPLRARALGHAPKDAAAREALWKLLREVVARASNPGDRTTALTALGAFDAPELVLRTWGLLLDGTLRAQDLRMIASALHDARPEVMRAVWGWVTAHYDALATLVGDRMEVYLPGIAEDLCAEEDARAVETFFEARRARWPSGLEHHLKLTLESIRRCAALKAKYGAATAGWLEAP